ncbi:MAG: AAA family ATPase [Bacteroidia bacterium]
MVIEKLVLKNFGPIKNVTLEVKDYTILIGTTSSGKSTVAKLISIFKSVEFLLLGNSRDFWSKKFQDYNIDFTLKKATRISYFWDDLFFELTFSDIRTNIDFKNMPLALGRIDGLWQVPFASSESSNTSRISLGLALNTLKFFVPEGEQRESLSQLGNHYKKDLEALDSGLWERIHNLYTAKDSESREFLEQVNLKNRPLTELREPLYFPAERILMSMVGNSILGLLRNNVSLPECIKTFGSEYELSRNNVKQLPIEFLNADYLNEKGASWLRIGKQKLKLEQSSSGFQSIVPLIVVLNNYRSRNDSLKRYLVIEEPELNLYPTTQKHLLQHIVECVNYLNTRLLITTHSPYVLTVFDNLIQAQNAFIAHPEREQEIKNIVPKEQWINWDRVSCYYFDKGTCRSTLNHEFRTLGSSAIDEISIEIGKEFDLLTDIQYI